MNAETPETRDVVTIGMVIGGTAPGSRQWECLVKELSAEVKLSQQTLPESEVRINVVFQIPGEVLQPDFCGVRTGRYSPLRRLLLVQAALPREVPKDRGAVVVRQLLLDALRCGVEWARHKKIAENLPVVQALAAAISR